MYDSLIGVSSGKLVAVCWAVAEDLGLFEDEEEELCVETTGTDDKWRGCFLYHLAQIIHFVSCIFQHRAIERVLSPSPTFAALNSSDERLPNA
jgi:predicted acylesterase/phospholipase RssA